MMSERLNQKYERLLALLRSFKSAAVAYSGGVDSSFLLAASKEAPIKKLTAFTMKRGYFTEREFNEAKSFADKYGVLFQVFELPIGPEVRENLPDRCYHCKTSTFGKFQEEMKIQGYDVLLDGTNADDLGEYRPGLKAVKEHGVRSPLAEAGLSKKEIRQIMKAKRVPGHDKPANTCLVTRFPYHTTITDEALRQIEDAENFLINLGYPDVRVRKHNDLARIEVSPSHLHHLLNHAEAITSYLKEKGFKHVCVDLMGYRTGSMDK